MKKNGNAFIFVLLGLTFSFAGCQRKSLDNLKKYIQKNHDTVLSDGTYMLVDDFPNYETNKYWEYDDLIVTKLTFGYNPSKDIFSIGGSGLNKYNPQNESYVAAATFYWGQFTKGAFLGQSHFNKPAGSYHDKSGDASLELKNITVHDPEESPTYKWSGYFTYGSYTYKSDISYYKDGAPANAISYILNRAMSLWNSKCYELSGSTMLDSDNKKIIPLYS